MSNLSPDKLLDIIEFESTGGIDESERVVMSATSQLEDILDGVSLSSLDTEAFEQSSRHILRELKVAPGESILVVNGRVRGSSAKINCLADNHVYRWSVPLRKVES